MYVCLSGLSRKDHPQVQKRSRKGLWLSVSRSGPTSMVPSFSHRLPSKGLPLCCPPAKVHTSPATPRRGLSPSPTSRVWAHSYPSPQSGAGLQGVFGPGLLASWPEPAQRDCRGARLGQCPRKGEGARLAGYLRGHWLGWRAAALPQAGVKTRPLVGITWA